MIRYEKKLENSSISAESVRNTHDMQETWPVLEADADKLAEKAKKTSNHAPKNEQCLLRETAC